MNGQSLVHNGKPRISFRGILWAAGSIFVSQVALAECQLFTEQGVRFAQCAAPTSRQAAATTCESWGMQIAALPAAAEHTWLITEHPPAALSWLSLRRLAGVWEWELPGGQSAPAAPQLWCEGEPGFGDCAGLDGGCWRALDCEASAGALCRGECNDAGPCTTATVDPATGACVFETIGGGCTSGDACVQGENCSAKGASLATAPTLEGTTICTALEYPAPQCNAQPYAPGNSLAIASEGGAKPAVASSEIAGGAYPIHRASLLNDGLVGNGSSWIPDAPNSWVKIDLGAVHSIGAVRIGRDRLGDFNDRPTGQVRLALALHDAEYADSNDSLDALEYAFVFDSAGSDYTGTLGTGGSVEFSFAPRFARFVKLHVESAGACLDEIEVFPSFGPICSGGTPLECDDNNPCTNDTCLPTHGCFNAPTELPCDDNNVCTTGDHCTGGQCVGTLVDCNDDDPCTIDLCDAVGGCSHTLESGPQCAFGVHQVVPAFTEAGALRTFTLTGAGLAQVTNLSIPDLSIHDWAPGPGASIVVRAQLPSTPGTFAVSVQGPQGVAELHQAITSVNAGFCSGVACDVCTGDSECIDGDTCTADYCEDGLCRHTAEPQCCPTEGCSACAVAGDVDLSGSVSVVDVQCSLVTLLWVIGGKGSAPPGCVKVPIRTFDRNCDKTFTVSDVQIFISAVLGNPLPPEIDPSGKGCPQKCEAPPPLTCGSDVLIKTSATPSCQASIAPSAGPGSACSPSSLSLSSPGATTAVCMALTADGAEQSCTQNLVLQDDVAPQIQCPGPSIAECTGECSSSAVLQPQIDDDCSAVSAVCPSAQAQLCLGANAVICTATDAAGNQTSCETQVQVVDTQAPIIACKALAIVGTNPGGFATVPSLLQSATDTCDSLHLTISQDPPVGATLTFGDHPVAVRVEDSSGNESSCEGLLRVAGHAVDAGPYGQVALTDPAASVNGLPCWTGLAPHFFPGTAAPVTIRGCFAPDYSAVVSVDFSATASLPPVGTVELSGQIDAISNTLCFTGSTSVGLAPGAPVALASLQVRACLAGNATTLLTLEYEGMAGTELGMVAISGNYSPQTGQLCMAGSLDVNLPGASTLGGVFELCLAFGTTGLPWVASAELSASAYLPPFGTAHLSGQMGGAGPTCLEGQVAGDTSQWLNIAGIAILELRGRACLGGGSFGEVELGATARLGSGQSAALLNLQGSLSTSGGADFAISLANGCQSAGCAWAPDCPAAQICSTTWRPFSSLAAIPSTLRNLDISEVAGVLGIGPGEPIFELSANIESGGGLDLLPGPSNLPLLEAYLKAKLVPSGGTGLDVYLGLGGKVTVPFGAETLLLSVEGEVTNTHLVLNGTVGTTDGALSIEPLNHLFGTDLFSVHLNNATAAVKVNFEEFDLAVELGASTTLQVLESELNLGLQITIDKQPEGWAFVAAGFLQNFVIDLGEFEINLGDFGQVVVAISSKAIAAYPIDEDGDPSNGKESTVPLGVGLNFVAKAWLPFLEEFLPGAHAMLVVNAKSKANISATGTLAVPLTLIEPEFDIPGIHRLKFEKLEASVEVKGKLVQFGLGGAVSFEPKGLSGEVQPPILGVARLLLNVTKPIALGGEIYLDGLWKHPFFFPDLAVQNPALLAQFTIIPVKAVPVPVPVSLGINGQIYVRKSGEWPATFELDETNNPVNLPPNILTAGGTLFFLVSPTASGICLPLNLKCLPLPTIIARADFQHLSLSDLVAVAETFRAGAVAIASLPGFEGLLEAFPQESLEPIDISPLNIELGRITAYLSTHNTTKFGQRFTAGIRAAFDGSITDLLGVKRTARFDGFLYPWGLELTAQMSPIDFIPGLDVTGDPHRRQATLNGGRVVVPHSAELASVRTFEAFVEAQAPGLVARKYDGTNGYELELGPIAPSFCDDDAESCPPPGYTLVAKFHSGGETRVVTSEYGAVPPGVNTHVAFTLQEGGDADFFVEGLSVPATESGAEDAAEDEPSLLPGISGAPLALGEGISRIDDVRVWTVARTPAQLRAHARQMPPGFRYDPTLALRLEFDYDHGSPIAHNSRLGSATAHGAYESGAVSTATQGDQDLYLTLAVGLKTLFGSFLRFRGGLAVDFDPPIPGATFSTSAEGALGGGAADGTLYVRNFPLFGIPGVGKLGITGNGPNAVKGDFDDGLYLSGNLMASPFPTLNASGRLLFEDEWEQITEVAEAAVLLDCLEPGGCSSVLGYTLRTQGALDLQLPLGPFGTAHVVGEHLFDSKALTLNATGSVTVFGQTFVSGNISLSSAGMSFSSAVDLGSIFPALPGLSAAQQVDMQLTFSPPRLCFAGASALAVPNFGQFDGQFNVCLGAESFATFSAVGSASLFGIPLADVHITLDPSGGLQIHQAYLNVPGIYEGQVTGHFKSSTDFALNGATSLGFPFLIQLQSSVAISPTGAEVTVQVNPGCPDCIVQSELNGSIGYDDGAFSYSLQGQAIVQVAGFTLAGGQLSVSSTSGFAVSGQVDLGIGQANVTGTLDTNTGAAVLTGNFAGSIFGGMVTTSGAATLSPAGANVTGTMSLWGSTASFAGTAGPGGLSVAAQMNLSAPTAAGPFALSNATVTLTHSAGQVQGQVAGALQWPGLEAWMQGSLSNNHFALTGALALGPAHAPLGWANLSLTPAGCAVSAAVQLPGLPALSISGQAHANPTNLRVNGTLQLGEVQLLSGAIDVGPHSASLGLSLWLGYFLDHDLGTASASLTVDYAQLSLCGTATAPFPLNTSRSCSAGICLGVQSAVPTIHIQSIVCEGFCLGDSMCPQGQFCDAIGNCWPKKGLDEPCAGLLVGDHECQSGFCDIWKAFPIPVCAVPLPDGIGCVDGGSCLSGHCGQRPGALEKRCYTPGAASVGMECYDYAHCGVGTCWGTPTWPSQCLCVNNNECAASPAAAAGSICKLGDWGITPLSGLCIAPRSAGQSCLATAECQSGLLCGDGICYAPASKHNWQPCLTNAECIQGECWAGVCRCSSHGHCHNDPAFGGNSYCDMGVWLSFNEEGRCRAPKVGNGGYCEDNVWCQSGLCANGVCAQPASKHNWQACNSTSECIQGECWGGVCRCASHAHCTNDPAFGSNSYCDMGAWLLGNQEGRCHAGKKASNTGQYCEDGNWCQSGLCTYSGALVYNTCYTHAGWPFDTPCHVHQQCANGQCVYWLFSGYFCN